MSGPFGAIGAWTSPALFVALATAVFGGAASAPILVLTALLAPLLALLQAPAADRPSHPLASVVGLAVAALVLWANLLVAGDLAAALGVPRPYGVGAAAVVAWLAVACGSVAGRGSAVVPLGVAALAVPLALLGGAGGTPPWTAWSQLASRSALSFSPGSAWVTEGRAVARPTTLTFRESHRVTAAAPGVYRVTERDGAAAVVREWRMAAGDALELRPGDQLTLPTGARVRFEAGKRIPGAAVSGVAWAEPAERRALRGVGEAIALGVTLAGGALALVPPPAGGRRLAVAAMPPTILLFVLAAVCWGMYAAWAAADLAIGATSLVPLLGAPGQIAGARAPRGLVALLAAALLVLLFGAVCALRARVAALAAESAGGNAALRLLPGITGWTALVAAAAAAAGWPADSGRALMAALGVAGATWAAPRLDRGDAAAVAGALIGAGVFAALILGAVELPPWAAMAGRHPVLVAVPAAAAVAWAARRARR
jgi:hypothetical protein